MRSIFHGAAYMALLLMSQIMGTTDYLALNTPQKVMAQSSFYLCLGRLLLSPIWPSKSDRVAEHPVQKTWVSSDICCTCLLQSL